MQTYSKEHYDLIDLTDHAFKALAIKTLAVQKNVTVDFLVKQLNSDGVLGQAVLPVPSVLLSSSRTSEHYLLKIECGILVTVEVARRLHSAIVRIHDTQEFQYTIYQSKVNYHQIGYLFAGRRDFKSNMPIALKVLGDDWKNIVGWVNEYLNYGLLEDMLNEPTDTSYIK